ncbi:hypothetical protein Adt_11362 [Abeliophyllum distichum]|uniref:Uncharacterized protein n=1 Tax=Abeliophyllum distichum TaxID=126358 RepID=A0ABD1UPD4_9LAMI
MGVSFLKIKGGNGALKWLKTGREKGHLLAEKCISQAQFLFSKKGADQGNFFAVMEIGLVVYKWEEKRSDYVARWGVFCWVFGAAVGWFFCLLGEDLLGQYLAANEGS